MPDAIFQKLIRDTADELALNDPSLVEKDFYVTKVLHTLADIKSERFQLVFIGGTCLSKAHRIVNAIKNNEKYQLIQNG